MQAVNYNSAAIKSAKYNPKRDEFFRELYRMPFDQLVKKYCSDPLSAKLKKRFIAEASVLLKKMGLLSTVKKIIKKSNKIC